MNIACGLVDELFIVHSLSAVNHIRNYYARLVLGLPLGEGGASFNSNRLSSDLKGRGRVKGLQGRSSFWYAFKWFWSFDINT